MYLFVDTEFTDFKDCDLISLGVVSEDGKHEFYVEINDHTVGWQSDFVKAVVVPLLDNEKYGMSFDQAGIALKQWIEALPDQDLCFIVDYGADALLLNEVLKPAGPLAVVKKVQARMLNDEFRRCLHDRGYHLPQQLHAAWPGLIHGMEDYFSYVDERRHHALVDAKANRAGWLRGLDRAAGA